MSRPDNIKLVLDNMLVCTSREKMNGNTLCI